MTKELAKTQTTELATVNNDAWGNNEMSQNDIVIPKIALMQPMSTPVTEGKAKFGDFVSTLDGAIVGNVDKGFDFIPFYLTKFHFVSKLVGNEFKFSRREPVITLADENKPWDDADTDGTPIKRTLVRAIYGMLPETNTPVLIEAKGTSAMFGKKLATQMYVMNKASSLPPCGVILNIKGKKEQNAKGKYAIMDFSIGRKTTAEEINACFAWYNTIKGGDVVIAEEEAQQAMGF